MSELLQLQMAVWFTGMVCIGCFAFLGWIIWHAFWDWHDHVMQIRKRRSNSRFDARTCRDAYRFKRGVHH